MPLLRLFEYRQSHPPRCGATSFGVYEVPRFNDLPELDIHLLNRTDLPSAGAGETPIIALAPAIGNAVFHAIGVRLREMPMRWNA